MKYYASYVEYYSIEVELDEDASLEEVAKAVYEKIDEQFEKGTMNDCCVLSQVESIIDENDNYVWEC